MHVRRVDALNGWQWIADGFVLFRKNPAVWVTLTVALIVIWVVGAAIPVAGSLLLSLVSPVVVAGLMLGCRALERGEELEVAHLFAGFRGDVKPLLVIGGVHLAGTVGIFGVVFAAAGGSVLPAVLAGGADAGVLLAALRAILLGVAVGLALYMPLLMLVWFAPALVILHGLTARDAMKLSFQACWVNVLPGLVYGAAVLVLWIIASIPLLLGLLVLLPVLACSIYTSSKDLFDVAPPAAPGNRLLA